MGNAQMAQYEMLKVLYDLYKSYIVSEARHSEHVIYSVKNRCDKHHPHSDTEVGAPLGMIFFRWTVKAVKMGKLQGKAEMKSVRSCKNEAWRQRYNESLD